MPRKKKEVIKENGKQKEKEKEKGKGKVKGISCHQCHHPHRPNEAIKCNGCILSYGVSCLIRNYPGDNFKVRGWICPRCRNMCNCNNCLKSLCANCKKKLVNDEDDVDVEDVEDDQDDVDVEDVEDDEDEVEDVEDVENDFTEKKEDELNATISSLQDGLKLEKEARMVLQIDMDVLQKKFQKLLEEDACLRTRIIKLQDDLKTATDSAKDEACKQIVDAVEHRLQGLFASEFAKVKEAFTGSSTDRVCCDKSSILEETTQRDQISVLQQALAAANQKETTQRDQISVLQQALAAANQKVSCDDEAFKQRKAACKEVESQVQELRGLEENCSSQRDQISILQQALAVANQKLQDALDCHQREKEARIALEKDREQQIMELERLTAKTRRLEEELEQAESRVAAAESRLNSELSSIQDFELKCQDAANEADDKVADVRVALDVWKDTFPSWRI